MPRLASNLLPRPFSRQLVAITLPTLATEAASLPFDVDEWAMSRFRALTYSTSRVAHCARRGRLIFPRFDGHQPYGMDLPRSRGRHQLWAAVMVSVPTVEDHPAISSSSSLSANPISNPAQPGNTVNVPVGTPAPRSLMVSGPFCMRRGRTRYSHGSPPSHTSSLSQWKNPNITVSDSSSDSR